MTKIAIVGVEGSGKTVMMVAMGEQWERPDERGYFLSPENAEAFGFSKSVMAILRSGRWPNASSHDEMRTLDWSLRRRQGGSLEKIADISMLDYAGEVYRQAFGGEKREGYDTQVATLRSHVDEADVLIVLVNLSDIINGSMQNRRTRDAMWVTKSVLDYALGEARSHKPQTAIVFTQADGYCEIITANGGPAGTLRQYLPHVANLYGDLPIFAASAIDRTVVGSDGLPIPAPGFKPIGLRPLMDFMIDSLKVVQAAKEDRHEKLRQEFFALCNERKHDEAIKVGGILKEMFPDDSELLYRTNSVADRNDFKDLYNGMDIALRAKVKKEILPPPASIGKAMLKALIAYTISVGIGMLMNLSPKLHIDWGGSLLVSSVIGGMIAFSFARDEFTSRKDVVARFEQEMR